LPNLGALRIAIANNLSTIEGVQVSAYMLANPTPPAIQVMPGPTEYHQTFGSSGEAEWWEFMVQAFVAATTDFGSQMLLDEMLASEGDRSVKAAIESDRSLSSQCDDLIVTRRSGYQLYAPDGRAAILGAEWTVRVFT